MKGGKKIRKKGISIAERKKAEEELIRLSNAVKMSTDSIVISDLKGNIIDVNEATLRMYGTKDKKDLIGKNSFDLIAPRDRKKAFAGMQETMKKGYVGSREYNIIIKDGSEIPVEMSSSILKDADGKVIGFVGVSRDITERKLAEEQLRSSEERLKILFEFAPDAYYLNDLKGNFIDGNRVAEEITGYKRGELIGKNFLKLDLLPRDQISKAAAGLAKSALGQPTGPEEFILNRKDGSQVVVEVRSFPVKIKGETLVLGIARDITERKRADAELKILKQQIEFILGSTKTGLDIIDSEFNIRFIDPAWAKVYGNPAGKKCYEYFMGRSQLCPSCGIVEALETKKPFIAEQVLVKENNRRIQVTTIPFQNEKGEWLVAEINVDITERKRMEEEVLEAKEDAELYLDIMSHDINNLNQVGLGYLELLLDGEKLDEAHRKYVGKALGSVRGSIRLIENVRLLQQIMEPSEFQNIDLSEVIAEVIDEFSINPYKKVNFNYDYSPKAGLTVRADPLIKEILVNLVGNSIKYSGESVEIGISVEKVVRDGREFYKVCVEDNGDGVPDDKKQTIFRRFERGTKKARGKGLGLYIVKMLVEKYGGEVWVEDRVKGDHTQGARFCYTIPSAAST